MTYLGALVRARQWIRRHARQFGADIIHVNTSALLVATVLGRPAGARLIWHIHEIIVRPVLMSWIFRLAPVLAADRVVAISSAVRDHLSPGRIRRKRISVIWNGIEPPDQIARGSRAPPADPSIAFVGRLNRWKGYELFVEAAARLVEEFPSARFVIAGDPPPGEDWRRHDLVRKIDELRLTNHVAVHGFCNDVPTLLEDTDVLAVPSIWPEPFGLVILEAMRSGCAVVATAHGGAAEIIEHGRSGLLVAPGSVSALTDAIARLLREPALRSRISLEARQRVAREFTVRRSTDEIERLYAEVLAPSRQGRSSR